MNRQLFFIIGILAFAGCTQNTNRQSDTEPHDLFVKSVGLQHEFLKKMEAAEDSISIDSLLNVYEKAITEINFSVKPLTDFKLTEQENDSLSKLTLKIVELKKKKLSEFNIKYKNKVDSIKE